jgi:hypothetical protein
MQTLMTRQDGNGFVRMVDMSKSRKRRVCGSLNIVALISPRLGHAIIVPQPPSQPWKSTLIRASFVAMPCHLSSSPELRVYSNVMKLHRKLNHTTRKTSGELISERGRRVDIVTNQISIIPSNEKLLSMCARRLFLPRFMWIKCGKRMEDGMENAPSRRCEWKILC